MKSLFISGLLALVGTLVSANDAFNNVTPVKTYKPIGDHNPLNVMKYSADPGVMVYDDTVYVYGTNDGIVELLGEKPSENEYSLIHTINVMSSKDLVNWVDHGTIPSAGKDGAASWAENSWAPAAAHKKINGKEKFFLYFANSGNGIGVLSSDSPTGPFEDPIGGPLVSFDSPNCKDIVWLFDPAVFVDDDGTGYLYFGGGIPEGGDEAPKTFRAVKLGDDMISLATEPVIIDAPWGFEDSGMHKAGDTYYYTYCTNWNEASPFHQARIGLMTSDSPLGPFKFEDTIFNNPGEFFEKYGNNHHTVVPFHDKWYIFYHTEWLNLQSFGEALGYRTTHVNELPFVDGKFLNATGTLKGVPQLFNVDAFTEQPAALVAWAAGTSTNGLGHTTVSYNKGEWTGVSNVDFADGADTIIISASSKNGAVIKITVDDIDGEVLGYVTVPANGDELENITSDIIPVKGVKNLFFLASDDVTIDTWKFIKSDEANTQSAEQSAEEPSTDLEDDNEESNEEPINNTENPANNAEEPKKKVVIKKVKKCIVKNKN
ncbi:Arabinanase/levansucrase/invertase [Anaeromyces robustus]|uniref:Arabinanase/levansucrase/invertase n=1 Tax=Anaeromyces robustus TaxID=1754192 RepID=A0A1Y1XBV6_9FUNG|nr:Arabinanase/levansucrase/invertase [Anaeromyces robustus]|eukprot:ORX83228.1 Arabinanase/levansucrase/invertase [Anaeromyces robustus]